MDTFSTWLEMGGYGGFIWPAYGFACLVLGVISWRSISRLRAVKRKINQQDDS